MAPGLVGLADSTVELAETVVAVRDERAHLQFVGERERLVVVAVGVLGGISAGGDLPEETQSLSLGGTLTSFARDAQRSLGECDGVTMPIGENVRLTQTHQEERLHNSVPHSLSRTQRVLQQLNALRSSSRERVGVAEEARVLHRMKGQVPLAGHRHAAFEQANGVIEFPPRDVERTETPARKRQAVWVIEYLREVDGLPAENGSFLELSLVKQGPGQIPTGEDGGKSGEPDSFPAPITFERFQNSPQELLGPPIVADPQRGDAEVDVPRHPQRNISQRLGDSPSVLAERKRLPWAARDPEVVAEIDGQLTESPLISNRFGQAFGFAETAENPLELSEGKE